MLNKTSLFRDSMPEYYSGLAQTRSASASLLGDALMPKFQRKK